MRARATEMKRPWRNAAMSCALATSVLVLACSEAEPAAPPAVHQLNGASAPAAVDEQKSRERPKKPKRESGNDEWKPKSLVDLDGKTRPAAVTIVKPGAPRIFTRALRAWIYEKPTRKSRRLGYLRAGASSPTSDEPAGYDGCKKGWYRIEPRGYVCRGRRATLDSEDPVVRAVREYPPEIARKLPYIYGTVRKRGPIYSRIPTPSEMRKAEPGIEDRMERWLKAGGEIGASYAQHVWLGGHGEVPDPVAAWKQGQTDFLPAFLKTGKKQLPNIHNDVRYSEMLVLDQTRLRVGYSFLHTFLYKGRRYGLSTDLTVLPTDRLRPIQGSDFRGVQIGKEIDFPFAFVRHPQARFFSYAAKQDDLRDVGPAPYQATLKLTGKQQFFNGRLHYETTDGKWLSDLHASRVEPAKRMPGWGKRGEKWIDVNLTKQVLMLYEGEVPVYATLISSGEAGLEDPEHTTATKRGIFRIHTKHVTATMSSTELGEEFELRDVPYVQYFEKEGYALHGAYWHDRFGMPKSHGCINLAPEDARRIFHWTEPRVPTGWHAALLPLKGTVIFVHP